MKQKTMLKQINQPNVISRKKAYRCLLCVKCTNHFGYLRCRHRDINTTLNIREIGMWYLYSTVIIGFYANHTTMKCGTMKYGSLREPHMTFDYQIFNEKLIEYM